MLFRGINKTNNKQWIIASDEEEALEFAVKSTFVRKKENCKLEISDENGKEFYQLFKEKGNDMTEVDNLKGVGCVHYKGKRHKGTWRVYSYWVNKT